jgi:hypothetical protein
MENIAQIFPSKQGKSSKKLPQMLFIQLRWLLHSKIENSYLEKNSCKILILSNSSLLKIRKNERKYSYQEWVCCWLPVRARFFAFLQCIVVSLGGKQCISFTTKVWQKVIIVQFMAVQMIADTRKNKWSNHMLVFLDFTHQKLRKIS